MARTLDFYQIYFKDNQLTELYNFATPYFNETLTPFFENDVIARIVPESDADYISVCSWRLRAKRGDCFRLPDKSLSKEKIMNGDFDIAVLTPRSPHHMPLASASNWHGRAWDEAFIVFKSWLKTEGVNVPEELSTAIYENHFIAKKEIYKDYVSLLKAAMQFTSGEEIFQRDSGYIHKKRNKEEVKEFQEKSGRTDWPILPFILERLFSIYVEGKGFKIVNL